MNDTWPPIRLAWKCDRILQDKLREKILGADQGGRSSPLRSGVPEGKISAPETAGVKKGAPEIQEPEVSGR